LFNRMNKLLAFAAIAEAATGLAMVVVPSLVGRQLLGAELSGISVVIARVTGLALIALAVACWPGATPLCGMLTYSLLVTLYLLYLGIRGVWIGPLLWPAVAGHAALSLLLGRTWVHSRSQNRKET
jgi:hypothetical protein